MKAEALVRNRLNPTEIGDFPSDWELRKLSDPDVAELIMGQSPPSATYNGEARGLPFLQGKAEFGLIYPSPTKWCTHPSRIAEKNDILMSVRAPVGDVNVAPYKCAIGRGLAAIRPRSRVAGPFLFQYLTFAKERLESEGSGSIFKSINKGVLEKFYVPLPERNEQGTIALIVSKIQQAIVLQDKLIEKSRELKAALMQKLFTEGLRGEEQKQTEIGLIPKSWELRAVGEICEKPTYGYTESASEKPVGPKFLRITDITEQGVDWSQVPYCKCPDELLAKYRLKQGDILFARIGATTGKSHLVENPPIAVYASYLIRVRTNPGLSPYYLYHYFNSELYWKQVDANKGNNLKKGVNGSILAKLLVPIPKSPEEQERIAETFVALEAKIGQAETRRRHLQALFQSMLNQLMTGKIRVKDLDLAMENV